MDSYLYKNITTNATTVICTGPSVLHLITINTDAAGSIIIKDGAAVVGTIEASAPHGTYFYDVVINGALSIVTAGSTDITASYRPN